MKTVQINKIKYKVFTEEELKEKLLMKQEDIELILEYQRIFPELLQDSDGFCIDGEKLCNQLEIKDNFNTWLLGSLRKDSKGNKKSEGKLIKYRCVENIDFVSDWISPNDNFSKNEIENMSPQKRSSYGIKNKIMLTLECAKKIAMRQNNERGDLVCNYFILVEKTLRNYESWINTREPEKENANKLKSALKYWASKNFMDYDSNGIYSREFNMLNKNLCDKTALEIKTYLGYKDKQTREHLSEIHNKALDELQIFDINLIQCNLDFETRNNMIKTICDTKYSHIKEMFK